jgi:STE24 endopeptidase
MRLTVLLILIMMSLLDGVFIYLTLNHMKRPLDPLVKDVYDEKEYQRFIAYTHEKTQLSLWAKGLNLGLSVVFFLFLAPLFDQVLIAFSLAFPLNDVAFILLYFGISTLLNLPFTLISTFGIEKRYGFSTITVKTFILDQIKALLLLIVLGLPLLTIILWLIGKYPNQFVLMLWGLLMGLSILIQVLYVPVFIPIFNKLSPLEEGSLKSTLTEVAHKAKYEVAKISMMNASKRSKRLNAFFTGFGKFKHIILFDTLVENLSEDEIASILAHEIGHAKHKDILRILTLSALSLGLTLLVLQFVLSFNGLASAFAVSESNLAFKLIVFFTLYEPINLLEGLISSRVSQTMEYKADQMMAKLGYRDAAISAFKVLARVNFSNLNPHPWVVKLTYSHPPIKQRIQALLKSNT